MSELSVWHTFLEYYNGGREYKIQVLVIKKTEFVNSGRKCRIRSEMQRKALHVMHSKISSQQLLGFMF